MNNDLYRPCVGIALFNKDGKVFVAKRIDNKADAWQMPQGGIDDGENLLPAALRELQEETGIAQDKVELIRIHSKDLYYNIPDDILERLHKIWDKPYIGQIQKWVAFRFLGDDQRDIDLNAHNPAEFAKWQWVDLSDVPELIVAFKKDLYQQIADAFSDIP